ncbi:MAG: aryl-sulfate sulfotransferase [Bdellovibrionales bacterium]|nr:aryl-sulfate sulfotransferase [Bdellovibrionales bacterium]
MNWDKRNITSLLLILLVLLVVPFLLERTPVPAVYEGKTPSSADSLDLVTAHSHEGKPSAGLLHSSNEAWPGLTLYPTSGSAEVLLVNMAGKEVHKWNVDADRARLLPNGNLLVIHGSKWGIRNKPWSKMRNILHEYNWNGEVVWEHHLPNAAHHDIQRLPNGNTLVLYLVEVPEEDKEKISNPELRSVPIRSDVIVEITPKGEEVWKWEAHKHLDLESCGARDCTRLTNKQIEGKKQYDWTHINTISVLPENKWYDGGDERFRPGNILIFPRNWWTALLIDKDSKEVVWQYSGKYKGGLVGGHEPYMIPKGLPGAGNILIFDNGRIKHESHILEVEPPTNKLAWVYDSGQSFYTRIAGSAQRFPNGNTLISEDETGRVFEVTKNGELVWSYQGRKMRVNRAHRYAPDYCPQFSSLSRS